MTKLFNFEDETLNKGFQIDMGKLSPEQKEHVLRIFEARGIEFYLHHTVKTKPFLAFFEMHKRFYIGFYDSGILVSTLPVIDYPTLCRSAVQLLNGNWTEMDSIAKRENLIMYAANRAEINWSHDSGAENNTRWIIYHDTNNNQRVIGSNENHKTVPSLYIPSEEFEQKLRGIYPVFKQSLTTEKPKYYKSAKGMIVKWIADHKNSYCFLGEVVDVGSSSDYQLGFTHDKWYYNCFMPCDYTPSIDDLIEKDRQANQNKPFCGFEPVPHFETSDNALPDQSKVLGFEFATEPVEVSPETEQQKETIADCGKKTLMDNPSLADNIGSHMNLAFDYAKKLVNENTRLRAQLYRLPMLEQENAELKAQLAAKNEVLSNTEQLPVGTIVHIVIEFANKKGYRMLHISEPNYTCKKAFEWAHNQAEIVEGIITSYNYIFPPIKQ